jgi:RNA polymerase sigma-70 factor (ECF subfamily)
MTTGGEGDEEAELFRRLYPSLRVFAAAVRPPEIDADDLVQEAVARTLGRHGLLELRDPGAYLRRAIVNLASNQRRRFVHARAALSSRGPSAEQRDTYPSDVAELLQLAPADRAVLFLVHLEGLSFRDAAAVLGCGEDTARQRAQRARRRLREVLEDDL